MRPSDWSIQKMLQSDWLVRIPPPYTTHIIPIFASHLNMRPPNGSSPFDFPDAFFSYRIKLTKTHPHNACHSTASLKE